MNPSIHLSAEDRLDIMELFARYAWAIDLGDAKEVVECFTEDAYFDHLWQGRVQGHEAIVKNLEALWYGRGAWWYGRQHLFNHFRFTPVTPTQARVKSFNQIIQFNVEYKNYFVFGMGTREDIVEQHGGRWYFKNLYVNAWLDRADVPWKGSMHHMAPPRPQRPDPTPPEFQGARNDSAC
jgi:hypothetical protein